MDSYSNMQEVIILSLQLFLSCFLISFFLQNSKRIYS